MKISRIVLIVIAIVIIGIIALFAYSYETQVSTSLTTSTSSTWLAVAGYPIELGGTYGVAAQPCVANAGYIYCIGGSDYSGNPYSNVYFSATSSSNLTGWTVGSTYPTNIMAQACAVYAGYIYCVGGTYDAAGDDIATSYYTSISQTGTLGAWNSTTDYPIPIDSQYCAAASGYIYCVGGNNETDGTNGAAVPTSSVWYAPISASGIGTWSISNAYPANIYFPSCVASSSDIYCVGGVNGNDNGVNSAYYAALTSSGVGVWTQTTNYPTSVVGQACSIASGYIYCVGGETGSNTYASGVFSATVSSTGIGKWKQASGYPISVETTCVASSTDLYCVGGFDSSSVGATNYAFYASLSSF
ncbi:MAG: hypothetical protein ABSE82_09790 [Nitrososphaerales archaeon]|jgi:hypothetical protein